MDRGIGPFELFIISVLAVIFIGPGRFVDGIAAIWSWWRNGQG